MSSLPVDAILPDLLTSLSARSNAVVIAPPGAGKTTRIAPALLQAQWCAGQVWLLGPRRLAVRAAAERIAAERGEAVGGTVGFVTRLDSAYRADTQLLVMTHGLFRSRIIADPELSGVSAVLFDEVHERSIDSDFGLALALDAQAGLRPDLRLVAMSATVDGARFAALLRDAPQFVSEGKIFPLTLHHLGREAHVPIGTAMAQAIRGVLTGDIDAHAGDILAFLPGVRDIERTADVLRLPSDAVLHRLHGQIDPALQREAIRPDPAGRRKVILASAIAETSLTVDGVRVVIDSGLARRVRHDAATGLSHLVTERASQAAATQRAGRAARQGPGTAIRLWEAAATRGMPPYDPPEVLEADLSGLRLDCARWGVADAASLAWIDPPPPVRWVQAEARLARLGALDDKGRLTPHGAAMAALPVEPALAHMLIVAAGQGAAALAGDMAAMLSEPGLGGRAADIETRLRQWQTSKGVRESAIRRLAQRLGAQALALAGSGEAPATERAPPTPGRLIAMAWPDRVARRRSASSDEWLSVGGRAYTLDAADPLASHEWLAIADAQGVKGRARITAAAMLTQDEAMDACAADLMQSSIARYLPDPDRAEVLVERRLGAIRLSAGPDRSAEAAAASVAARLDHVRSAGLASIGWSRSAERLRTRARYAGLDALDDTVLLDSVDEWLAPLLERSRGLRDMDDAALTDALKARLGWDAMQTLRRLAPADFVAPTGTTHPIDYGAPAGPTVTLRVQALFGLTRHPVIGTPPVPLVLSLTSPAGRPIQTTRDLPGFWAGSWGDVAREMRGRYPRHAWPDDPAAAIPSLRTKAAQARGG